VFTILSKGFPQSQITIGKYETDGKSGDKFLFPFFAKNINRRVADCISDINCFDNELVIMEIFRSII
jgi:hypothetical protein